MIVCLLVAQLAAAPAPAAVRFELPNGLRVWVQEDHTRPVALVQVTYRVGSLQEGPGTTGIAHYVEHMVYRATENVRNEDIYGYIDRIGGRYTGGTWPDFTRYAETVPSWAVESALRVTAERMSRALFDSVEFERERSNVVTEANGFAEMDAVSVFRDAVLSTSFELHPYRYSSNTWARDNLRLTRAEAFDWYKRYYGPNNAVLVVVGDVTVASVRRLVDKHFESLPRAPASGEVNVVEPPQHAEKRVTLRYDGNRKHMEIVYRAPEASDRDYPVLVALNRMLTPALARIARETHAEIASTDSATPYPFVFRISVAADTTADLGRILGAIEREIESLRTGAIGEQLAAARPPDTAVRGTESDTPNANFPSRQSNLTRVADQLSARERFTWEVSEALFDSIRRSARAVTSEEVQAYAKRWLRESQRTVGFLVPGPDAYRNQPVDVPALTTMPAKRRRPEPVPAAALRPLAPVPLEQARRVLSNGIPIRAARVPAESVSLRVVVDYGGVADTIVRRFLPGRSDSALKAVVADVRAWYATRPATAPDTSVGAQARARVLAGITPVHATNASMQAVVTVSAAGPRPAARLVDELARHFQALPRNLEPRAVPAPFATVGIRQERIPIAGATQVTIVAGLPGVPKGHADRRALELLNYIVGVPWYGGRLGWALTKSGLSYSSAATTTFGARSGHILFSTLSDTRNAESTIQAVTEVVEGIGAGGVEEWELREAQAFTLGRTLLYGARDHSGPDMVARALSASEEAGVDQLDLPALSRAYLSVTLADLNRVARTYYRREMLKTVAVGAIPGTDQPRVFPAGTFRAIFEP